MNNGNSFHNGEENLELQNRNRAGAEEPASEPSASEQANVTNGSAETSDGTPYYSEQIDYSPYRDSTEDAAEKARLDKFNMASLILGIASFAGNICCLSCLTPFSAILAIIFAAMGRINGRFQPKGLGGMILGISYLALLVLSILYIIMMFVLMGDTITEIFNEAMNEAMAEAPLS